MFIRNLLFIVLLLSACAFVFAAPKEEDSLPVDNGGKAVPVDADGLKEDELDFEAEVPEDVRIALKTDVRNTVADVTTIGDFQKKTADRQVFCPSGFPFRCTLNRKCCRFSRCCRSECCVPGFDRKCTRGGFCLSRNNLALCRKSSGKLVAGQLCSGGKLCCDPTKLNGRCSFIFGRLICASSTGIINCAGKAGRLCSRRKCCQLPKKCCRGNKCC